MTIDDFLSLADAIRAERAELNEARRIIRVNNIHENRRVHEMTALKEELSQWERNVVKPLDVERTDTGGLYAGYPCAGKASFCPESSCLNLARCLAAHACVERATGAVP